MLNLFVRPRRSIIPSIAPPLLASFVVGCLPETPNESLEPRGDPRIIAVVDAYGTEHDMNESPRRPTLVFDRALDTRAWRLVRADRVGEPVRLEAVDDARAVTRIALASGGTYSLARADREAARDASSLKVGTSAALGAVPIGAWPPYATGPADSPRVIAIGFDGMIGRRAGRVALPALVVTNARGDEIARSSVAAPCESVGLPGHTCLVLVDPPPLEAVDHVLSLADGGDATGAPIEVSFGVPHRQTTAPTGFAPLECTRSEVSAGQGCVRVDDEQVCVRARTTAPTRGWARFDRARVPFASVHGTGSACASAAAIGESPSTRIEVALIDPSGTIIAFDSTVIRPIGLARVTITEVCANPTGREPADEYVELFNYGDEPLDVGGFVIADSRGMDALPAESWIPSGGRALVGSRSLVVVDAPDSVPIFHVDASIGSDGITNGGESIALFDREGRRLSESAPIEAREGTCLIRRGRDRTSEPTSFEVGACSPGS